MTKKQIEKFAVGYPGTIIFYLGHFGYSSIAGGPLVSIICGAKGNVSAMESADRPD